MSDGTIPVNCGTKMRTYRRGGGIGCGGYGVAFVGAAVYFIQHAASFWEGVLGVLKAMVWPALLVYKALEFFKM